ncbi:CocE/NonD family hydrolase [Nocardia carnea]|uniref:CocE/NonD family hydrolase n=1 Tax=Nocardia carnea TaxID=37328 RepID=UPI0024549722|nr:CocE/NonD family hydrolase [Nocardia carnea]
MKPTTRPFALKVAAALGAALVLAGCSTDPSSSQGRDSDSSASGQAQLIDAPGPDDVRQWLAYDRQADFDAVKTAVRVPTRDGTDLACNLFRPGHDGKASDGRYPSVVLNFTPYALDASDNQSEYLAERGYNVAVCNVRGSGESGGEFPSWFQPVEPLDNYDLIEWLAAQPYSTGDVGQVGGSYGSITAYRVAALNPPHLRTIVPVVSPTNIYAEWVYPGGVPTTDGTWWATEAPIISPQAHADTLRSFQNHPTYDKYWKQVATTNKLASANVPVLYVGGYFDIFKAGGFDAFRQKPEQTWLLYGPWDHAGGFSVPGKNRGPNDPDPAVAISYATVLQWFDHWVSKRDGADLPADRVTSFESTSEHGGGRWTKHAQWPAPTVENQRLYPAPGGQLADQPSAPGQTTYSANPYDGPSVGQTGNVPTEPTVDQAESEVSSTNSKGRDNSDRTTFTLPAYEEDTVVAGPVTLHLNASITAADTYFISKLEAVTTDGRVLPIETGNLRAQLRTSLEKVEPVPANAPVQYTIDLGHTHWRFKTGEKLRVTLSSGDFPRVQPTAPAGLVTINHGPQTYLEVPVLPNQ